MPGTPVTALEVVGKANDTGTRVTFKPDSEIFSTTDFKFDTGEIMKISRACQNEFRNNANRYLSSKYL